MDGRRATAVAALAVAILALGAGDAGAAVFCGKTITTDLTLKRNLNSCAGDGLVVGAPNIKIDLNGHTIDGTLADNSEGIYNNNYDGVVVKGPGRIDRVRRRRLVRVDRRRSRTRGHRQARIRSRASTCRAPTAPRLTGSIIKGSQGTGVGVVHCEACEVRGNAIQGPATSALSSYGISVSSSLGGDNLVKGNLVRAGAASDFGMLVFGSADHTRIRSNVFRGREIMSEGISVYNGATNTLVKGNAANSNIFNGIDIEGDAGAGTDVGGNTALNNGQYGIRAVVAVTDLGGNKARRQRTGRPMLGRRLHPSVARLRTYASPLAGTPVRVPRLIADGQSGEIVISGARAHNLKGVDLDPAAGGAGRRHRPLGLGQVEPRLRHDLRRGPAPLRRVAVRLRAPVPRPDGEARRRLDRGAVAGDLDRPEDDLAQPALDGRHRDRDLRLPAPALGADRPARTASTAASRSRASRSSRSPTG